MADVIPFPQGGRLSGQEARSLLNDAVSNSEKLVYVTKFTKNEEWYRLVTISQVRKCLTEGDVVEGPTLDEKGNWYCLLYCLCAGARVYVTVSLQLNADRSLKCAFVLDVNNKVPT